MFPVYTHMNFMPYLIPYMFNTVKLGSWANADARLFGFIETAVLRVWVINIYVCSRPHA